MLLCWIAAAFAQELEGGPTPWDTGDQPMIPHVDEDPAPVVGGHPVKDGKWDDAVGIVIAGSYVGCTGTLVGPKVVITAGHCLGGLPISHVLVGSKDWLEDGGEIIEVEDAFEYPDSQSTYDIGVVTLKKASSYAPRAIALECVLDEYLTDGAKAQIVGFGATTESGTDFNTTLNEAPTTILDKNCTEPEINGMISGCHESVSPGGEIAAGGDGTDACFGDSGGPLYLKTDEGNFLVGVTSRAFLGVPANAPCRDGGIWVRPDAVIEWIDDTIGKRELELPSCNVGPTVDVPEIEAWGRGGRGDAEVDLEIGDEDGDPDEVELEISVQAEHGTASLDGLTLSYDPDDGYEGDDTFLLTATDAGNDAFRRTGDPFTTEVWVDVTVHDGRKPLFAGCATAPAFTGLWPFAFALLALRRMVRA
jgi:hypothetical protein